MSAPTHLFYGNDPFLFCQYSFQNINKIVELFSYYGQLSGQHDNWDKSHLFFGSSVTSSRRLKSSHKVGMKIGALPFSYLGDPFFKGSPIIKFLQPIIDKIMCTLESCDGASLAYAGRVCMGKFCCHILICSLFYYLQMAYCFVETFKCCNLEFFLV